MGGASAEIDTMAAHHHLQRPTNNRGVDVADSK
jgi:hypothetical protein